MITDEKLHAFQADIKELEVKHGVKLAAEAFVHQGMMLGRLAVIDIEEINKTQSEADTIEPIA